MLAFPSVQHLSEAARACLVLKLNFNLEKQPSPVYFHNNKAKQKILEFRVERKPTILSFRHWITKTTATFS